MKDGSFGYDGFVGVRGPTVYLEWQACGRIISQVCDIYESERMCSSCVPADFG